MTEPARSFFQALAVLSVCLSIGLCSAFAQSTAPTDENGSIKFDAPSEDSATKLERLNYIQDVLTSKIENRRALGNQIETANEQDKEDLRKQAEAISTDIEQLRDTLENIAIGGLDTSLFEAKKDSEKSSWQDDIALIAEPVIDSLKELTEKPRKLAELNETIKRHEQEVIATQKALANLELSLALNPQGDLKITLEELAAQWYERGTDAENAIGIARIQIAELQGSKSISETVLHHLSSFITGRGLTLVLAIFAAAIVWYGLRFLLRGYRATISNEIAPEQRTRYRLAAYSVHALTFVFTLLAVFGVFYERGDVLLLGLLILLIFGLALGIRHLLPRYISEARLLLNIGPLRENERVFYNDLPWRVESINMYTVLENPELNGSLRVPLAALSGFISRAVDNEPWFPSSLGDVILLSDNTVQEIIDQNPDTVELKQRGGQISSIPTKEFYRTEMVNLSRGGTFGVCSTFGIDYQHQAISLSHVPDILIRSLSDHLTSAGYEPSIRNIEVELKEANSSSLDYWVFITCNSTLAHAYLDIQRIIHSACVKACTDENLSIPFPHLAIVNKGVEV
ncbi:MAG: hypothetical protein AB8B84_01285 [Granulosicoccus sp.]